MITPSNRPTHKRGRGTHNKSQFIEEPCNGKLLCTVLNERRWGGDTLADSIRRDKRLKSVSTRASRTMGKGGKLHKGFCSNTYRKCRNINQQIAHIVSKRIANIAQQFNAEAIVFENLKGWKAKGGRKRSTLRQRFHGWLKSMIRNYTQMKWQEAGGKVIDVVAAYTSKLAYDGSGIVQRDSKNYALAKDTGQD